MSEVPYQLETDKHTGRDISIAILVNYSSIHDIMDLNSTAIKVRSAFTLTQFITTLKEKCPTRQWGGDNRSKAFLMRSKLAILKIGSSLSVV